MAAVASYYTHPAPASHPHQHQKNRGHRMCDCCGRQELPGQRFRTCGGCMVTQYCSQDCQKQHWGQHKPVCQHTASQVSSAKYDCVASGMGDEDMVKNLRKFCSAHNTLISWSGFQALQLKRVPSNIRQQALVIDLAYRPSAPDSARRFVVTNTQVVPRGAVEAKDPLVTADIHKREARCRQGGGLGTVVILVQCGGVTQVMPVEVDNPNKIHWDARPDWADMLRRYVEAGRVDFKPVSSVGGNVIYG